MTRLSEKLYLNKTLMPKFNLTTKNGEVISKVNSKTLEDAITVFSINKKLNKNQLLNIYDVTQEVNY